MTRRVVRATPDFFVLLDQQLGDERGPNGEPSAVDFAAYELIPIIEESATGWDDLTDQVPGHPEYRVLFKTGPGISPGRAAGSTPREAPHPDQRFLDCNGSLSWTLWKPSSNRC